MEELAVVVAVVLNCTSPIKSDFVENVSHKLVQSLHRTNPAAARYAVDLAKRMGLLSNNLVWTNLGHLLNVVYPHEIKQKDRSLPVSMKYLFFRLLLEFDGAALLHFARKVERDGQVPQPGENWSDVAQTLFCETYDEYLKLATDPLDRIRLRQITERRQSKPFQGKSGPHQCFLHLTSMERLGLVSRTENRERSYTRKLGLHDGSSPTGRFLELVPDVIELERSISNGRFYQIAFEMFNRTSHQKDFQQSFQSFIGIVKRIYNQVVSTGVSLCSLQTITEAIQIESLMNGQKPPDSKTLMKQLNLMQASSPRDVRFHVDVYGRPSFLKLS